MAGIFFQPVDARHEQRLEIIGDGYLFQVADRLPAGPVSSADHGSAVDQSADNFFDEEGVAFCFFQDHLPQPLGQVGDGQQVVDQ